MVDSIEDSTSMPTIKLNSIDDSIMNPKPDEYVEKKLAPKVPPIK
jgi:hypothetical protein